MSKNLNRRIHPIAEAYGLSPKKLHKHSRILAIKPYSPRKTKKMETKVCKKCGRELPLDKFSKGSDKDGLQKTCKDCVSVYMRDYAQRKKQQV